MRYKIIAALGTIAALAGLVNPAQAQSTIPSNAEAVTLSGDSLNTIESRTVEDDFGQFFLDSSLIVLNDAEDDGALTSQDGNAGQISEDVRIFANETIAYPIEPIPLGQNEALDGVDRVLVQINLNE